MVEVGLSRLDHTFYFFAELFVLFDYLFKKIKTHPHPTPQTSTFLLYYKLYKKEYKNIFYNKKVIEYYKGVGGYIFLFFMLQSLIESRSVSGCVRGCFIVLSGV